MEKRLALTIDGKLTYCSADDEHIGTGSCKHVLHQNKNEGAQDFLKRAGSYEFDDDSNITNPAKDNDAIAKEWNQNALDETRRILNEHHCCIINQATGSGKSSILSALIDDHYDKQSVFFSPSTKINDAFGDHNKNSRSHALNNLRILTYQMLLKKTDTEEDFKKFCKKYSIDLPIKLLCLDEIHHLTHKSDSGDNSGNKEDKKWTEAIQKLIEYGTDQNTLIVGATATVEDDEAILDGRFKGKLSSNISFEDAISRGILQMPHVISKVDVSDGRFRFKNKKKQIDKRLDKTGCSSNIEDLDEFAKDIDDKFNACRDEAIRAKVAENDTAGKPTNIIIFSKTVIAEEVDLTREMERFKEIFPEKKIEGGIYDTTKRGKANEPYFNDFCKGRLTDKDTIYLLAVHETLNEGVHADAYFDSK